MCPCDPPSSRLTLFLYSEKPLSLQILLTETPTGQSSSCLDRQAPPLSPCLVQPLRPSTNSVSDSAPTDSPRKDTKTRGPCSRFGKPLTSTRSLPALCVDTWDHSPLAPPPPPEEGVEPPSQWTMMPMESIPGQAPPTSRSHSQTPSPDNDDDRRQPMGEEEQYHSRHPQTTPPTATSRQAPPPAACPSRKWSCLHPDQPDSVHSPEDPPPVKAPLHSPPDSHCSGPLPPTRDCGAGLPVERWADNITRYYSSQHALAGRITGQPDEEMSELDSLYQASLLAPSMHRGSRGLSPQTGSNRPGRN